MEPRIQYAQTKDGVSIAYRVMGVGLPLVLMPCRPSLYPWSDVKISKVFSANPDSSR